MSGEFDGAAWLARWRGSPAGQTALEHGCDPGVLANGWHLEDALRSAIGLELFGLRRDRSPEIQSALEVWKHADASLLDGAGIELSAAPDSAVALGAGGGEAGQGGGDYGPAFDFADQGPAPAANRRFVPQRERPTGLQPGRGMEPAAGRTAPEPPRSRSPGVARRRRSAAGRVAKRRARARKFYRRCRGG